MVLWTYNDLQYYYESRGVSVTKDQMDLVKSAGVISTALSPEYFNPIYGKKAFIQLNTEVNGFAVLPKEKWMNFGVRVVKSFDPVVNIGETDALPNNPTHPDIITYKLNPKQFITEFQLSKIEEYAAQNGYDDVWGAPDELREIKMTEHIVGIAKAIGKNATDISDESVEITPLDKIVSGYGESHLIGNSVDVYGLDRHTAPTILDAYVNAKSSDTDPPRTLTSNMILETIVNIQKACGERPEFIYTGYNTYAKIIELYENYVRYSPTGFGTGKVKTSINGVQTAEGTEVGIDAAYIYGIPVITSQFVPNDAAGTSEKIYMLNTKDQNGLPKLSVRLMFPTSYYETDNPFIVGSMGRKGMFYTAAELVCRRFNAQGKIRDIAL